MMSGTNTKRLRGSPGQGDDNRDSVNEALLSSIRKIMVEELDIRLVNIATKTDIDTLNTKVLDLQTTNNILIKQNEEQQKQINENNNNWSRLDRNLRMKNIIFKNIQDSNDLTLSIHNIIQNDLGISEYGLLKVSKLSSRNDKVSVIAEFTSGSTVSNILWNSSKLREKAIYVEKDLTPEQRSRKLTLLKIRKAILQQTRSSKVNVYDNKIIINRTKFIYDEGQRDFICEENVTLRDFLSEKFLIETDPEYAVIPSASSSNSQ